MRLFLYGTLLNPALLTACAGHALPLLPASLPGWRRVALPGGRYPTLRRARAQVAGALVTVNAATFGRLAAYEGPSWRLVRVVVRGAGGNTGAYTWIAPGGTPRDWP